MNTDLSYAYKIHSSRLRKANWSLDGYGVAEARRNGELVALGDSQALRFIRELRGISETDKADRVRLIRTELVELKRQPRSKGRGERIAKLYEELYSAVTVRDYLSIVMDSMADFDRLNHAKGFTVNGVPYRRWLATPGGVKKNTVVYVSEELYPALARKVENGRDLSVPLVPAKYEAYKALTCSASKPVPEPAGVLVVQDCKVPIEANVVLISDEGDEPEVTEMRSYALLNHNSDGYGLIAPELSRRWAEALGLDYVPGGFCIRNAFVKGMLYTFDYQAWSKEIAQTDEVVDVWGSKRSVTDSEIVLTESMLKLWSSYDSIEQYLACCQSGGYTFSVTKTTPKRLDHERDLNYQFLQSLELTDADIEELIAPTINEIQEVLGGDYRKTLLFLKGMHMDEASFEKSDYDYAKALMIDPDLVHDPYVRSHVHKRISRRIQGAKMGELRARGNYAFLSGDPYALCQSIFGMEVTGLLGSGQFYHRYWSDRGVQRVAGFRAPMTCHHNIRMLPLADTAEMRRWYAYLDTVVVFNAFDTAALAMNGADMDGDAVFTTDNPAILRNIRELDAIVCMQRSAAKKVIEEPDLIRANKLSFGDRIGSITNRITAMYDVLARFEPGSDAYRTMEYRIRCGQNFQQNAIDRTKGIESRPMPKGWYDYRANADEDGDDEETMEAKRRNRTITADKKPYFMIYRYPELKKDYDKFRNGTRTNCLNRFGCTVEQLAEKSERTEAGEEFLTYYRLKIPVSTEGSVMNRICWKVEAALDGIKVSAAASKGYDHTRLKSDSGYRPARYKEVAEVLAVYQAETKSYAALQSAGLLSEDEENRLADSRTFVEDAYRICNDEDELCSIVVDLCYTGKRSKQFAWDIAGETMIRNLLKASGNRISYPVPDPEGELYYRGERFTMRTCEFKGVDWE